MSPHGGRPLNLWKPVVSCSVMTVLPRYKIVFTSCRGHELSQDRFLAMKSEFHDVVRQVRVMVLIKLQCHEAIRFLDGL